MCGKYSAGAWLTQLQSTDIQTHIHVDKHAEARGDASTRQLGIISGRGRVYKSCTLLACKLISSLFILQWRVSCSLRGPAAPACEFGSANADELYAPRCSARGLCAGFFFAFRLSVWPWPRGIRCFLALAAAIVYSADN